MSSSGSSSDPEDNAVLAQPPEGDADRRSRPRSHEARVLTLAELEAIRLTLRGGSVVDWYRLNFDDEQEIRGFLRLLEGDLEDPRDVARLQHLRDAAAEYLAETHGYRLPDEMLQCPPVELFWYASEKRGRRRDRFFACLLLKVMHIIHHIEARELRYRLSMPHSQIAGLIVDKVDGFAKTLQDEGFPLARYTGGEKTLESLITKLLVKKEHHAATIHDLVRFRFVVQKPSDLVPLLHQMTTRLLPFSYVVPGSTVNHLVNFTALIESHEAYRKVSDAFQVELGHEENALPLLNEFSGPTFRVINFAADVPVRVPEASCSETNAELGRVVFGLAEFQVVDAESDLQNEAGDNRHDRYKGRQLSRVRARLERGLRRKWDGENDDP